uniref:Retrovirus-related Pol polyprotein from transposon TNT 1-94-like beta-barrel domain-containing protein n=1 Tax=Tanacetum cinerariifolium TaxID=118510 RepID=A0A699GUK1_TANCI|nr:hypothetical protein [Tanacetum cinerariifolium]
MNPVLIFLYLILCHRENGVTLDEEQLLFSTRRQDNDVDEDVDEQPVLDLALNVDNVFQADDCDAFHYDVDEAPAAQTMFMANLSSVDPVYDEVGPFYDSDILSKVYDHDHYQDSICEHHEVHEMHDDVQPNYVVDSHADYTSNSNMIPYDQYVKDNAEPVQVQPALYNGHELIKTNHVLAIVKKMNDKMKDPECVKKKVKIAPHDYSKENYLANFTPHKQLNPEQIFWSNDLLKMKEEALKEQTTTSIPIKALTVYPLNTPATLVPRRAENEKVKRHYKELYDSIKITRAQTIEKTNSLLITVANLKDRIKENQKSNYVTMHAVKSKMLALGMYVIDVEPIPPRIKNNREVHLDYLKHLKESVATLHDIVKGARVEKPFHSSLAYACRYTKHSQELVEYVTGTCPNDFNKGDKQIASTLITRKKQVTFINPCETSTHNNLTHVKQQTMNKTNEPVIPSTGVNGATAASESKRRSNTKKDRTLPAKIDMKKVEVHHRNNKSSAKQKNRVDSSIIYKRTSVKKPPFKKVCQIKQVKQAWQATRKLFATIGHQWRPTGRKFTLGEQCPLTRITISKVVPVNQVTPPLDHSVVQIVLWYLDSGCSKHMTRDRSRLKNFVKMFIETVRFGNDHFGTIMGYGDYVIGRSVISRVYYEERLGHNLFSVR